MTLTNELSIRDYMTMDGVPWPSPLPELDSPFVEVLSFTAAHHESTWVDWEPPQAPERTVPLMWDEDGFVEEWRELSEQEYATAVTAFEAASVRWRATGGRHRIQGPLIPPRVTFRTETGAVATGYYAGGAWHWLELSWIPRPPTGAQKK